MFDIISIKGNLYDFSSTSIIHYDIILRHLDFRSHTKGEKLLDLINTIINFM